MRELDLGIMTQEFPGLFPGQGVIGNGNSGSTELLGKRVVNKSVGTFGRKQVIVGERSGDKRKQVSRFLSGLESLVVPPMSDTERARFNVVLPGVFEALLNMSDSSYIAGAGEYEIEQLAEIGLRLASPDPNEGVAFRVVFGSTEQMPLRALSYAIPALAMMERLQEATGNTPQLQIIFADHVSSALNRLDLDKTTAQSTRFSEVAAAYIGEFFPGLVGSVIFLRDSSLGRNTTVRTDLISLADSLSQHVTPDLREELDAKGNGSGRLNPYYAAAHLLMHDRGGDEYVKPALDEQPEFLSPSTIVSFGGAQERLFYKVRHVVKPHLGSVYNSVKTFQYFTRHHVPPYYMARGGDIALDDVLKRKTNIDDSPLAQAAAHDLDYLRSVSMGRGDLNEFLKTQRSLL